MSKTNLDYLQITLYEENNILYSKWTRDVTQDEYRAGIKQILRRLQQPHIYYWISDCGKLTGLTILNQQWLLREIAPALCSIPLKKIAHIGNDDVFSFLVMDNIVQKTIELYDFQADFMQFKTYEAAVHWLGFHQSQFA
ncbi:hypothetical protein [Pontibacter liquoris]|uniref:hypothetical protein n=1 Tax=Pontibacter liquoris TaxID=2905677 RepID=UPI001FA7B9E0|nr:hypothetical protein [Pontibacter liquoris]